MTERFRYQNCWIEVAPGKSGYEALVQLPDEGGCFYDDGYDSVNEAREAAELWIYGQCMMLGLLVEGSTTLNGQAVHLPMSRIYANIAAAE